MSLRYNQFISLFLFLTLLPTCTCGFPWRLPPKPAPPARKPPTFTTQIFSDAHGNTLRFRLLYPADYSPAKRYPLVVSLHGSGSEGSDNAKQLGTIVAIFTTDDARKRFPCFVLAPQCPPGAYWVSKRRFTRTGIRVRRRPGAAVAQTLALLPALARKLPIDTRRVYVLGYSSGGTGVWDIVARHPALFAAAVAMSGRGDRTTARRLINLPIWVFQGENDRTVPRTFALTMIRALRRAGGQPRYTEYPGADHNQAGARALREPGLLPWLFAQHR